MVVYSIVPCFVFGIQIIRFMRLKFHGYYFEFIHEFCVPFRVDRLLAILSLSNMLLLLLIRFTWKSLMFLVNRFNACFIVFLGNGQELGSTQLK
jgi:hypothetical protein